MIGDKRKQRFFPITHHLSPITYYPSLIHTFRQQVRFQFLPLVFGVSAEVARHGLDRDAVIGTEPPPEQKTRVVLPGLVGNLVSYFWFLFSHFPLPRSSDEHTLSKSSAHAYDAACGLLSAQCSKFPAGVHWRRDKIKGAPKSSGAPFPCLFNTLEKSFAAQTAEKRRARERGFKTYSLLVWHDDRINDVNHAV